MPSVLSRIQALETEDAVGKKAIYISIIAPLNWQDVVAVRIEPGDVMRFVTQIFREGTEHIPQKTYDKLSDEDQVLADRHLADLHDEAIERLSSE